MNLKQRLQQDLQAAIRAQDRQRLNVIRMLLTALERAQEDLGKQAFESSSLEKATIQPDRNQILSEKMIEDIIRTEVQHRREAADTFRAGGENTRAESEESEISIFEQYLKNK